MCPRHRRRISMARAPDSDRNFSSPGGFGFTVATERGGTGSRFDRRCSTGKALPDGNAKETKRRRINKTAMKGSAFDPTTLPAACRLPRFRPKNRRDYCAGCEGPAGETSQALDRIGGQWSGLFA